MIIYICKRGDIQAKQQVYVICLKEESKGFMKQNKCYERAAGALT